MRAHTLTHGAGRSVCVGVSFLFSFVFVGLRLWGTSWSSRTLVIAGSLRFFAGYSTASFLPVYFEDQYTDKTFMLTWYGVITAVAGVASSLLGGYITQVSKKKIPFPLHIPHPPHPITPSCLSLALLLSLSLALALSFTRASTLSHARSLSPSLSLEVQSGRLVRNCTHTHTSQLLHTRSPAAAAWVSGVARNLEKSSACRLM
jgi:hypothetical protein